MDELRAKLTEAEGILGQMVENTDDDFEKARLRGKREGVNLVRSYLSHYLPSRIWAVLNKNGSVAKLFWSAEDADIWAENHPETSQRLHSYPVEVANGNHW